MTTWPESSNITSQSESALAHVNSHAILDVKGEDAVKFLQGQCSADIQAMAAGESLPGAICTVKGRVITSFIATKTAESVLLLMPRELVTPTADYLKKYAAFYKVELCLWLHPCVIANTHRSDLPKELYTSCDFQLGETEFHAGLLNAAQSESLIELLQSANTIELMHEDIWLDSLLQAGWLLLNSRLSEEYLPHQLNLDLLGAVNFKKGCYTGQEIIARMEYRGKTKKRLMVLSLTGNLPEREALPVEIRSADAEQPLGELIQLDSTAETGLALLPVDLSTQGSMICNGETLGYQIHNQN